MTNCLLQWIELAIIPCHVTSRTKGFFSPLEIPCRKKPELTRYNPKILLILFCTTLILPLTGFTFLPFASASEISSIVPGASPMVSLLPSTPGDPGGLDLLFVPPDCEVNSNPLFEESLLELINTERVKNDLQPLVLNEKLTLAARKHSLDMACNNYFSHYTLSGATFDERIAAEGYHYFGVGENIYAGDNYYNNPLRAFKAWLNSPRHYEVMMHPELTEVGIGYAFTSDSKYGGYFTADFASPGK